MTETKRPLFLFVGPSGSGKTRITKELEKTGHLSAAESYTTRPKRKADEAGHVFVTAEEWESLRPMLAEAEYAGHRYGIPKVELDKFDMFVVEPSGVEALRKAYTGERPVYVIAVTVSEKMRRIRMRRRGDSEESIETRLTKDREHFSGYEKNADYVISNEDRNVMNAVVNAAWYIGSMCADTLDPGVCGIAGIAYLCGMFRVLEYLE